MKTCTRCGANAYVDADPYCEHAYHEPPMPLVLQQVTIVPGVSTDDGRGWKRAPEMGWHARGYRNSKCIYAEHPTRDGAIALWQERWTWGPAIAALLGWLCERPRRGAILDVERDGVRQTLALAGALSLSPGDKVMVGGELLTVAEPEREAVNEAFAEIVNTLREEGRVVFTAGAARYAVERWATPARRGYSLERKGAAALLRFGTAGPILEAIRVLLVGGDPFAQVAT